MKARPLPAANILLRLRYRRERRKRALLARTLPILRRFRFSRGIILRRPGKRLTDYSDAMLHRLHKRSCVDIFLDKLQSIDGLHSAADQTNADRFSEIIDAPGAMPKAPVKLLRSRIADTLQEPPFANGQAKFVSAIGPSERNARRAIGRQIRERRRH